MSTTPRADVRTPAAAPARAEPPTPRARVAARSEPSLRNEPVRIAMRTTAAPAAAAPESPRTAAPSPRTAGSEPTETRPEPTPEPAGEPTDAGETGADRRRAPAGKRTIIRDDFLVEGKLEKPSAYYLLRRSSLDYDWARLDAKFSPLVLESVQDPLF